MRYRIILCIALVCIGGCMTIISRITETIELHRLGFAFYFIGLILLPVNTKTK